jgi:hypothetical protein
MPSTSEEKGLDLSDLAILEPTYRSQILVKDAITLLRSIVQRLSHIVSADKNMQ